MIETNLEFDGKCARIVQYTVLYYLWKCVFIPDLIKY